MAGIKIYGTGRAVPEKILTNDDLSRMLDTNDEWIFSRTGIRKRHIKADEESAADLAVQAAKEALLDAEKHREGFRKEEITAVYVATMTSDYVFPSTACILQKELGLPSDVRAFDICAACTGFVYSLQSAFEYLHVRKKGYALVVGSECMSKLMDYTDRSTCILFGDGAGAAVIGYDDRAEAVFLETQGTTGNTEDLYCGRGEGMDGFLHMNGQQVYKFASVSLKRCIEQLLAGAHLTMNDIDMVICHQANARIIDSVVKRYPGSEDKFYKNMDEYANTSAASAAIAMDDMFKKGLLRSGQTVIAAAFGAGLSWNGILMTI